MNGRLQPRRGLTAAAACLVLTVAAAGCATDPVMRPEAAAFAPPPSAARPAARQGDPGADALVGAMRRGIALVGDEPWGEILVSLEGITNQSHAGAGEFDAMRTRLARLLTGSGRGGPVLMRFVSSANEPVDYELRGTAYLVTTLGFDVWELYLGLYPEGRSWTVWSPTGPVRLLRQARGGQQIFP